MLCKAKKNSQKYGKNKAQVLKYELSIVNALNSEREITCTFLRQDFLGYVTECEILPEKQKSKNTN